MQGLDRLALQTHADYGQPRSLRKRVLPVKIKEAPIERLLLARSGTLAKCGKMTFRCTAILPAWWRSPTR